MSTTFERNMAGSKNYWEDAKITSNASLFRADRGID